MTETRNPWLDALAPEVLTLKSHATEPNVPPPAVNELLLQTRTGPPTPQDGVPAPRRSLPVRRTIGRGALWIVGAHGGAGESSIASLGHCWLAAGHAWPEKNDTVCPTVVVARTHARGLLAAQDAITQWAGRRAGPSVQLLGLVLIPDSPGRLPRPLHDLAIVVRGGAPRTWEIPWIEAWRQDDPRAGALPRPVRRLVADLYELTAPATEARPPTAVAPAADVPKGTPA